MSSSDDAWSCQNCGFENPPGMNYCGMCGEPLPNPCPACGFVNPPEFRFCGRCGAALEKTAGAARETQASPSPGQKMAEPQQEPTALPQAAVTAPAPAPKPATRAPAGEDAAAKSETDRVEGERRVATIMLADVQRSTDLLERIGTESWVEIMNRVFQLMEAEIYRFGGRVDQFRGDGLVAFFGARAAHEDDPERAIMAALAMQDSVTAYAEELAKQDIALKLRMGINTGEVIVARVGDRRQYSEDTAMGEAIAVAARMESAAEPGTVLVSEHTHRLVASRFAWESLGKIKVKGVQEPIAVYRPLVPQDNLAYMERVRSFGFSPTLIGRQVEFETLKHRVEDLYAGRGGIVLVTGETGIGKSFLVTEVRHHFARQGALLAELQEREQAARPGLTWLRGRCRSYEQSWPYSMWSDLLKNWLGVSPSESEEASQVRLRQQAEALWGDAMSEYYPYLADFLSLPLAPEYAQRVKHLDAEGKRQRFFLAIRNWLAALANGDETGGRPVVTSFHDVHWADTASLDLLEHCLPLCDQHPLLWLIIFHPDRASLAWELRYHVETEYPHRLSNLAIPPLTEEQSGEFIDQLIGPEVLPEETCSLIINKAEGNPYYIRELIHSLVAQEILVQDPESGKWRVTRTVTSIDLPDSLQSLLLARIDRLDADARHVLQAASVIGPLFWSDLVRALLEDAASLSQHLTRLQREDLIRERGRTPGLGMEYAFNSALIRDALYEGLLRPQRVAYHRQITVYFEANFDLEKRSQYNSLLAYHHGQAGERRKELDYLLRAARNARKIYANPEAVERYTEALQLIEHLESEATEESARVSLRKSRFAVLKERSAVFRLMGKRTTARADSQSMLNLAHKLEDEPAYLIDALLEQPGVLRWRDEEELRAGLPLAKKALALARQINDRHREIEALGAIANQRLYINDPAWQEAGEEALEIARELGDQRFEAQLLIMLGKFCSWTDQPEQGMAYLKAALPICKSLDDKMMEIALLDQLGLKEERRGDYYCLLTEYQQKRLQLSREIGYRDGEGASLILCAQTRGVYLGDYEGAMTRLNEALQIVEGTPGEMFALLRVMQLEGLRGNFERGLDALERAQQIDEQVVFATARAGLRLGTMMLYNDMGDEAHLRAAQDLISEICDMLESNPLLTHQYEIAVASQSTALHLGLIALTSGEEQEAHRAAALEASQHGLETYEALGFVQIIECVSEEVLFRHSQALRINGREAEANEYLRQASEEMMRKYAFIPKESPFRRTYLENIALHREIQTARRRLLDD